MNAIILKLLLTETLLVALMDNLSGLHPYIKKRPILFCSYFTCKNEYRDWKNVLEGQKLHDCTKLIQVAEPLPNSDQYVDSRSTRAAI
jgi:hypothetical protein